MSCLLIFSSNTLRRTSAFRCNRTLKTSVNHPHPYTKDNEPLLKNSLTLPQNIKTMTPMKICITLLVSQILINYLSKTKLLKWNSSMTAVSTRRHYTRLLLKLKPRKNSSSLNLLVIPPVVRSIESGKMPQ